MKKLLLCLLMSACLLTGCSSTKKSETEYNGPVVSTDTLSDQDKELMMIQECISDYNSDAIADRESYYGITIPALPLGLDSLPQISSLNDLEEQEKDQSSTNAVYVGTLAVSDLYTVKFRIYHPSEASFWLNGSVSFLVNLDSAIENDPQYADTKNTLDSLLTLESQVLSWLYGMDVTLSEQEGPVSGYYEVLSMGSYHPTSIAEVKQLAEQVFTAEYLEANYYPGSFEGADAIYMESGGKLYCASSNLSSISSTEYATEYILGVSDDGETVSVDLLSRIMNEVNPEIKRIDLTHTDAGLRLQKAF